MIALTDETRGARLMRKTRKRTQGSTEREPKQADTPLSRRDQPVLFGLAQTAGIDHPVAPPAQTRSAKIGIRAGHHAPESDSNHTDLPLGTDLAAGRPKRTRYVVA
jgi:hypothetical protein